MINVQENDVGHKYCTTEVIQFNCIIWSTNIISILFSINSF